MKAVAAFRESGCLHPLCPTHQKLAKLRMVKDKMKQNYGHHSLSVQSEKISASFGSGEMFMSVLNFCANTVWCAVNVKSRKMAQTKTACFTAAPRTMLVVSLSGSNKGLVQLKPALCSSASHFNTDTRETFTSTKSNTKDAYEEHKFLKSVDALTSEPELS